MIKSSIDNLVEWIEEHKHLPLRIDDIASRSGYSKWYLQRVFTEVTGINIATYCRRRRLALAAQVVKYSSMPLAEIASWFDYDSQQTLNKEFMKHFRLTPGQIRQNSTMNWEILYPALQKYEPEFNHPVTLTSAPVANLQGVYHSYMLSPDELDKHPVAQRKSKWDHFLAQFSVKPDKVYCLTGPELSGIELHGVKYGYITCVSPEAMASYTGSATCEIPLIGDACYAKFTFRGHYTRVESFIKHIYNVRLHDMQLNRVDGMDIEEFILQGRARFGDEQGNVALNYYVPVKAVLQS